VPVPAVEVDQPGCSFNPDYEAHQDAIAAAVAREYKRQLRQELAPSAPSLHAPADYKAPEDELDALLNEAGGSSEEEEEDEEGQQQQQHLVVPDENAIALDDDDEDDGVAAVGCGGDAGGMVGAAAGVERKTRRDRNREARRRAADADASVKAIIKRQRQQLDALPELQAQLEEEEAARELMRTRRRVRLLRRRAPSILWVACPCPVLAQSPVLF
jgi:nucleolar protein 53